MYCTAVTQLSSVISLHFSLLSSLLFFFFFNDTATTEIYTLSLHDALPIWSPTDGHRESAPEDDFNNEIQSRRPVFLDRKSTRLNSSHPSISYAVFCLKKKKKKNNTKYDTPTHYICTTPV